MGKGEVKQIHPAFEDVNPPMMHHAKIRKLRQTVEGGLGDEVFIRNVLLSSLDLGLPQEIHIFLTHLIPSSHTLQHPTF